MRKLFTAIVVLTFMASGCSWLGLGDDSSNSDAVTTSPAAASESVQIESNAPADPPSVPSTKKASKGSKSEAQIKKELDAMGQKIAGQAARTLTPNKAHKEVVKRGNEWVATYIDVDTSRVRTEMRPSATPGQYVGIIRYQEEIMECRGATKEAALSAPCTQRSTRNLREMIAYDGKRWQD